MKEYMLIGEFSEVTGVSKRMIRHFDKIGLLSPDYTDECNGYRFYSQSQIDGINRVKFFQDLGFTLKEIQSILSRSLEINDFLENLKDQEALLRNESDKVVHQLLKLQSFISYIEQNPMQIDSVRFNEFEIERSIPMDEYAVIKEQMEREIGSQILFEKMEELSNQLDGEELYFITFDLDQFLYINDDFGYTVGDKVIYRFYQILKSNFIELLKMNNYNMISRLGGDEFALFLVGNKEKAIIKSVEAVLKELEGYDFSDEGCNRKVTGSCGIAKTNKIKHRVEMRHISTKALIEAKKNGSNQYKFISTVNEVVR